MPTYYLSNMSTYEHERVADFFHRKLLSTLEGEPFRPTEHFTVTFNDEDPDDDLVIPQKCINFIVADIVKGCVVFQLEAEKAPGFTRSELASKVTQVYCKVLNDARYPLIVPQETVLTLEDVTYDQRLHSYKAKVVLYNKPS